MTLDGLAITTVEGIGSVQTGLHPVQERIAQAHGIQCGFCTPGFVMSMYTLLKNNPKPQREDIENNFHGNICRCTGYRSIINGFYSFCDQSQVTPIFIANKQCRHLLKILELFLLYFLKKITITRKLKSYL